MKYLAGGGEGMKLVGENERGVEEELLHSILWRYRPEVAQVSKKLLIWIVMNI